MSKRYRSVMEMMRDTTEDPELCDELEKEIRDHGCAFFLHSVRCRAKMSQRDLARKLGTSEEHIDALESRRNSELTLEDVARYASGLGLKCGISLENEEATSVDMVKFHTLQVFHYLNHLAALVEDDHAIKRGVENFFEEYMYNAILLFLKSHRDVQGIARSDDELEQITETAQKTVMRLSKDREEKVPELPTVLYGGGPMVKIPEALTSATEPTTAGSE